MKIGYARISRAEQSLDLQLDALIKEGVDKDRIYTDVFTGKKEDRPGIQNCIKALQPGNILVIWKLDRLGRSLKNLVDMIEVIKEKKCGLKILTGLGSSIDTTTPEGKMLFGMFATLAEFEHDLIIERTQAGLAAARARGRSGGRPRKVDAQTLRIIMAAMADRTTKVSDLSKRLGLTKSSIYTYVNSDGSLKESGIKLLQSAQKS